MAFMDNHNLRQPRPDNIIGPAVRTKGFTFIFLIGALLGLIATVTAVLLGYTDIKNAGGFALLFLVFFIYGAVLRRIYTRKK